MAISRHLQEALSEEPIEEGRRKKGGKGGGDSLPEVTSKVAVFAKTQGGVIRSYAQRFRAAAAKAPTAAKEEAAKLQGVLDQLEAAFSALGAAASELERKL